ncbi:MAG TPA: hypothetical protein DEP84_19780 [Chloroflexi bacterium]|nr:hypothetical protein [Chloroflexota bacterium]
MLQIANGFLKAVIVPVQTAQGQKALERLQMKHRSFHHRRNRIAVCKVQPLAHVGTEVQETIMASRKSAVTVLR